MYSTHSMWWLWWVIWTVFMISLLAPVGYGWGYRGWGPPVPTYVQRRRMQRAAAPTADATSFNHAAWGWRGDLAWVFFVVAMAWLFWLVLHVVTHSERLAP